MNTVDEWPLVQRVAAYGIMTTVDEWPLVQHVAASGIMTTVEEWFLVPLVTDSEDGSWIPNGKKLLLCWKVAVVTDPKTNT